MTLIQAETVFYWTTVGAYILSALFFLASIRITRVVKKAYLFALIGLSAHTLFLVARGIAGGRIPAANLYEFVLLFTWGTALLFVIMQQRYPAKGIGAPVMLVVSMLLIYAGGLNKEVQPLMPALQSYWLKLHVAVAILAYGSFAVSFGAGLLLLLGKRLFVRGSEQWEVELERLMNNAIAFGFPFMTLVLVTGAVWAEQVWGTWWSWDPKETWALITWLIYAIYLHGRLSRTWGGKQSAWMVVIGFGAVIFTLFGVTWLLPGLHSYV